MDTWDFLPVNNLGLLDKSQGKLDAAEKMPVGFGGSSSALERPLSELSLFLTLVVINNS
jgi:hypothetical protein